jgi:ankyrin repeat protein
MFFQAEYSLLFHSVIEEDIEVFNLLLECGAQPLKENDECINILHLLMKRNLCDWADLCLEQVKNEVDRASFANNFLDDGWYSDQSSPLTIAAGSGHLLACTWLLDHGANVNSRVYSNWTPLHSAAKHGHMEIVKLLLERGADVHRMAHGSGWSHATARDVATNVEVKQLLQQRMFDDE